MYSKNNFYKNVQVFCTTRQLLPCVLQAAMCYTGSCIWGRHRFGYRMTSQNSGQRQPKQKCKYNSKMVKYFIIYSVSASHSPSVQPNCRMLSCLFLAENLLTVKLYEIKPNLILFLALCLAPLLHICIANCAKVVHGQCPDSD